MESPMDFIKHPVAVVGMGLSGEAALRLLKLNKITAITYDDKEGAAQFHKPEELMAKKPATLVVSPGYPLSKPWIQDFLDQGGVVTSELALALGFFTRERVMGVTGSVGKSTTVSLLEAALKAFSPDSFVGGNIGRPLSDYASDLLEKKRKMAPWVVLELSSYQLENCGSLQLDFGAITYLTPNHMERYPSLEEYYETKWRLVSLTRKAMVFNKHGGDLLKFSKGKKLDLENWWVDQSDEFVHEWGFDHAKLLGAHNQDNLAVAGKLALLAGWPSEAMKAMAEYPGLAHRMENLGVRKGIQFINDSKATTMESVKTAAFGIYERMDRKSQLILMLGGKDKNLPWEQLKELKKIRKLRVVFFGEVAKLAREKSSLEGEVFPHLRDAVGSLPGLAKLGDTVLLSPGGTSWDEFKNFEERGRVFKDAVEKLF